MSFDEAEQLLEAIHQLLDSIYKDELITVFSSWIKRTEGVINHNGDHDQ
jgi:hypothetical protein